MWNTSFNNNCLIESCVRLYIIYIIYIYIWQKHEQVEICKWIILLKKYGRGISVLVATWLWAVLLRSEGLISSREVRNFSSSKYPQRLWGPHRLVPDAVSPGIKLRGASSWLLTPSGTEIKDVWRYTSISPTSLRRCV